MFVRSLFMAGAVAGSAAATTVDCSDAAPWEPKVYPGSSSKDFATVHYKSEKYIQQWYAAETDVPKAEGVGPWKSQGQCTPGTDNKGPSGPTINCSEYEQWVGSKTYAEAGKVVVIKGKAYVSKWWSKGEAPGTKDAWDLKGTCTPGTEPKAVVGSSNPELDRIICSCCKDCAEASMIGPQCHNVKETGGQCYFTDCTKINTFDEKVCKDVNDKKKYLFWPGSIKPATGTWPKRVFAPYIDSGLATMIPMSKLAKEMGVKHFVLAFVTQTRFADDEGCRGAVAGMIDIKQGPMYWDQKAAENKYLWDEVNALREAGGDVVVSFGGAANTELADAAVCQKGDPVANLVKAYSEVIDYLKLTHIDFDIEGNGIASNHRATGWKYRFQAIKALKEKYPYLKVWYTLPILPAGLTLDGLNFVTDLMTAEAPMDIMNVMNMDYGDQCPSLHMGECEREAMDNLAKQMLEIAQKTGKASKYGWTSVQDVWPYLGSTPMIGTNDVTSLIYRIEDARDSVKSWVNKPIGLISQWSTHRDHPCPEKEGAVDLNCSSVKDQTEPFQFAKVFNEHTSS